MKNLYKYIAYSLLTVSAVGMFSIGYKIDRMQERVTKLGYVSTELYNINRGMKCVNARADELNQNALLKDITDNDPAGIKEVRIQLKESAYLLGLNLQGVMNIEN